MHEEGVKWFWYTASVFDLLQQRKHNFPVMNAAADVLLLVVVRVHSITLCYQTQIFEHQGERLSLSDYLNDKTLTK